MKAMDTESQVSQEATGKTLKQYSSIHDLPFDGYVAYICDEPTKPALEDAEKIQEQFNDACGTQVNTNIPLYAEIEALGRQYELVEQYVEALRICPDLEPIAELLSIMGYGVIDGNLDAVLAKAKALIQEMEEKLEQVNEGREETEEKGITRTMFVDICARLTKHFRTKISIKEIMTDEFCSYYKLYNEEIRQTQTAPLDE